MMDKGKIIIGISAETKEYQETLAAIIKIVEDHQGEVVAIDTDVVHGRKLSDECIVKLKESGYNVEEGIV